MKQISSRTPVSSMGDSDKLKYKKFGDTAQYFDTHPNFEHRL